MEDAKPNAKVARSLELMPGGLWSSTSSPKPRLPQRSSLFTDHQLNGVKMLSAARRWRRLTRAFSTNTAHYEKQLPPRLVIPETDLDEKFLKGTGPGGQKINKTSSAVQLKHLPTGIVVKSQDTRSREQNRRTARRILGEKLEDIEKGPLSRTALRAEKASKKKASAAKKSKRKYRKLDEEKARSEDAGKDVEDADSSEVNEEARDTEKRKSDSDKTAP